MILKVGIGTSFQLFTNVQEFHFTNKILPNKKDEESWQDYRLRIGKGEERIDQWKDDTYDMAREEPLKARIPRYVSYRYYAKRRDTEEDCSVRHLSFEVHTDTRYVPCTLDSPGPGETFTEDTHYSIYTEFPCYVCDDRGMTLEVLK